MLAIRDSKKLPSVLTIAKGAELYKYGADQLVFDAQGEATVNVVGGTIRQTGQHRIYIQSSSTNGTLRINVTDGGLLDFPLAVLALCCPGNFPYYNPSLYMVFNDSTFRVRSGYSDLDIFLGCPDSGTHETYRPINPTGVIAATNSVFDVGRGIFIGRSTTSAETAGSYTADFENCVITAKTFAVNHDRPLNNARLNGTRFVFGAADGSIDANDGADNWFTVGTDGLTIDTQGYVATLNANLGGSGAVTKVGSGTLADGFWTGLGGDGKMSTGANWANRVVPGAGTDLDFSSVLSATTVDADTGVTYGAVTMGDGVITFTNSLTVTGFSDGFKVAVGENSTVTVAGDYVFSASVDEYICNTVAAGGRFVVTGDIVMDTGKGKYLRPCAGSIAGTITARGLVNKQSATVNYGRSFALAPSSTHVNWEIGEDGISGSRMLFVSADPDSFAKITASADFTVSATVPNYQRLELDAAGHVITLGDGTTGGLMGNGTNTISGTGRVVANYDIDDLTTTASSKIQPFVVKNAATFAIMPGADIGSGAVTVESGATLEVAASGTATHRGNLSLADGACLGFNFTEKKVAPQLALASGKTATLPATVTVKISAADGKRPKSGKYVLTSFGGFDAEGVTVQLAADAPQWVKSLSVNDDGNLELAVKRKGFTLIVK